MFYSERALVFVCFFSFSPRVWTRSTSVTTFWPSIQKKKKNLSEPICQGHDLFIGNQIHHPWYWLQGKSGSFIKEEAAPFVNWQTLMEFACSVIVKLVLIFAASDGSITHTHTHTLYFAYLWGHFFNYSLACNDNHHDHMPETNPFSNRSLNPRLNFNPRP